MDEGAVVARLRAAGCVFAEDEARLLLAAAPSATQLAQLLEAREAGAPLEQLLGWADFAGVRVAVRPGVFVPRRRSELLVREAVRRTRPGAVVVDLCCGTGAVGLAVARRVEVELHAVDIDAAAVGCARENLAAVGGRVHEGDLFTALPAGLRGRIELVVANAPYVPSDEIAFMPGEARDHEHRVALDGGADGLDVQRRIVAAAPAWLAGGGALLIETSRRQAPSTVSAMSAAGLRASIETDDELAATVAVGGLAATR
jgi:release factor glutamine methyltransferase